VLYVEELMVMVNTWLYVANVVLVLFLRMIMKARPSA
jgi:hypothetical protein